jgi:hypothetical protein
MVQARITTSEEQRADVSQGRLPDFLIIGAQRSGTTSLARYLGAHPQIFMAGQKEVHYFDRHHDEGPDWYRAQFAAASASQVAGEATPEYMYDPVAFERMATLLPGAKVIISLRNPVDRAYSEYWFVKGRGYEELSFADALDAEATRVTAADAATRMRYAYTERGRYLRQLKRVCEVYPRDRMLVVIFEEFSRDPRSTVGQIQSFLGVEPEVAGAEVERQFGRARSYRSQRIRRLSRHLPYPFGAVVKRLNAVPGEYPAIDPEVRKTLEQRFRNENLALAEWLGRDLSVWDDISNEDGSRKEHV